MKQENFEIGKKVLTDGLDPGPFWTNLEFFGHSGAAAAYFEKCPFYDYTQNGMNCQNATMISIFSIKYILVLN